MFILDPLTTVLLNCVYFKLFRKQIGILRNSSPFIPYISATQTLIRDTLINSVAIFSQSFNVVNFFQFFLVCRLLKILRIIALYTG